MPVREDLELAVERLLDDKNEQIVELVFGGNHDPNIFELNRFPKLHTRLS